VWIGFPSHADLWADDLEPARVEVAAFARAVHAEGAGERVVLVAADEAAAAAARVLAPFADVVVEPFGDVWLRDTGPILTGDGAAQLFRFNGWGGKYDLPGDADVGARLAARAGLVARTHALVLEGGAIDGDGTGRYLTTRQCMLNPNRNPDLDRAATEAALRDALGLTGPVWLGDGLLNDHTDGHVDNLARFVAQGRVVVPEAAGADDPNAAAFDAAARDASAAGLGVVRVPSPGRVERDGEAVPASYMNFYIGNAAVVVPNYGAANDDAAVAAIAAFFPGRAAVGVRSDHLLTGGGSLHCISQQVPA
jgi:agmatine deiminase